MGGSVSSCRCRKRAGSLAELGVPDEHKWEGLDDDRIQEYLQAKERVLQELQKSDAGRDIQPHDPEWIKKIPGQAKDMLKGLLLRRAVGLVHVLKPIEEQRRAMRMLQTKGYLPDNHMTTFEKAEEICGKELQTVMEEWVLLEPAAPPNAIIQSAVQAYHQHGSGRPSTDADEDPDGKNSFEDVKRGFLKNKTTSNKVDKSAAHGFAIGSEVEAHSLQTESLNGARGRVKAERGERVAVAFPEPIGEKALKPANLRPVQAMPPMPQIHPDAKEPPTHQLHISLSPKMGESLGLSLSHEPPQQMQKPGQESCLLVTGILPDGYVSQYNSSQKELEARIYKGDRIIAVVDCSVPESRRAPVGGNSKLIMEILASGRTPLVLFVCRVLGPPLRFRVGQQVRANCGMKGWLPGVVAKVWEQQPSNGSLVPYVIRKLDSNDCVCAPVDSDEYVMKGEPRFKVGDSVMFNQEGAYRKGEISEVRDEKIRTAYSISVKGEKKTWNAPEDTDNFVRPMARYKKGTKVLAKVQDEYVPGTIEAVYHPNWVYSVRLDKGNLVYVPRDEDLFMKKR